MKKLDFYSKSIIKNCAEMSGQSEVDLIKHREETIEHCNQRKLDNHIGYQSTEDKS